MHGQSGAPMLVLFTGGRQTASLGCKLLGHGTDVIRLKATAAADVTHPELIGLTSVLVRVPASEETRLQSCQSIYIIDQSMKIAP